MPLKVKKSKAITEFTHLCGGHLGFAYIYLINVTFLAGFRFYDPKNIQLGTKITVVSLIIKRLLARMYFYIMAIMNIRNIKNKPLQIQLEYHISISHDMYSKNHNHPSCFINISVLIFTDSVYRLLEMLWGQGSVNVPYLFYQESERVQIGFI